MNELTDFISREELTQILTFLPDPQADQVLSLVENHSQLQERMQAELSEKQRLLSVIQKQESQVQNLTEKCERMNEADKIQEENRKLIARNQQLKEYADDALAKMNAMKKRCDHYYTEMLIESNKRKDEIDNVAKRLQVERQLFNAEKGITLKERVTMRIILIYAAIITVIAALNNECFVTSIVSCIVGFGITGKWIIAIFTDFWETSHNDWLCVSNGVVAFVIATILLVIVTSFSVIIVVKIGQKLIGLWHRYYQENLDDYVSNVVALSDLIMIVFLEDKVKIMRCINVIVMYICIMVVYFGIRLILKEKWKYVD